MPKASIAQILISSAAIGGISLLWCDLTVKAFKKIMYLADETFFETSAERAMKRERGMEREMERRIKEKDEEIRRIKEEKEEEEEIYIN